MTKLLLLDNESKKQKVLRVIAHDATFVEEDIVTVGTLEEAETHLQEPFDVAVIDIHLGNGLEDAGISFIARLHRAQPECKIIALTVYCPNSDGVRALAYGASDFISGNWGIDWQKLLFEKLSIFKALIEDKPFPLTA